MRDYKNITVTEPMSALDFIHGLCFGLFFYGFIFFLLII